MLNYTKFSIETGREKNEICIDGDLLEIVESIISAMGRSEHIANILLASVSVFLNLSRVEQMDLARKYDAIRKGLRAKGNNSYSEIDQLLNKIFK